MFMIVIYLFPDVPVSFYKPFDLSIYQGTSRNPDFFIHILQLPSNILSRDLNRLCRFSHRIQNVVQPHPFCPLQARLSRCYDAHDTGLDQFLELCCKPWCTLPAQPWSEKDFIHKLRISLKELRETQRWLKLIQRAPLIKKPELLDDILEETEELIKIFVASIKTAGKKQK